MKKLSERIQIYFMATAFTDVGEFDTAVRILEEKEQDQKRLPQKNTKMPRMHAPGA